MNSVTVYIGIGSNLGDPLANVQNALRDLAKLPAIRLTAQSSLFRSVPVDADGQDYVNAVARIETSLAPEKLLQQLHALELAYDRKRPYINAPRTLDLDILLYGEQQITSPSLSVPHPRLTERAFALLPMLQIDPFITIPGKGPAHVFVSGVAGQQIHKIETA